MDDEQEQDPLLYLYSRDPDETVTLDGCEYGLYRVELVILKEDDPVIIAFEYDSTDELEEAWTELVEEAEKA